MDTERAKTICDVCAIFASGFTFIFERGPQIAAVLSAIWLLTRLIEWGHKVWKYGLGKDEDQ